MTSAAVKRIEDVRIMRSAQFLQDSGPMAHPIRPESYIAMDNFYTVTVYNKGAEVIRMYHTLLGEAGYRKGADLYFERHDGSAATCDDFRAAMADANGVNLDQFERWYTQAGTPSVRASGRYDAAARRYELTLSQSTAATPGQPTKEPFHVPVAVRLLLRDGTPAADERVLSLTEAVQTFTFDGVPSEPVPSLLRGFSAPVKLVVDRSDADLAFLASADDDAFNRWDATQQLSSRVLLALAERVGAQPAADLALPAPFVDAFRATLTAAELEPSLRAYSLTLPDYSTLSQEVDTVDPDALLGALRFTRRALAEALRPELTELYRQLSPEAAQPFGVAPEEVGRRRLRNLCLSYLSRLEDAPAIALCREQFAQATCMSDSLAATAALAPIECAERDEVLGEFYARAKANKEELVINKWFTVQASTDSADALDTARALMAHEAFDMTNPNRVRSVVNVFAANPAGFHVAGGGGYAFVADLVLEIDQKNPQVAARLAGAFGTWRRYTPERQALMKAQLERIKGTAGLSKDTYEIVSRTLA